MGQAGKRLAGAMLLCLLSLLATLTMATPRELQNGWEYRWGDSPFLPNGTPAWTLPGNDGDWRPIGFPSNPPNREGHEHAWFRITLPAGEWRDPVLYIYSIDLIAEAYLGGERIYRYGAFDADGEGRFAGWPWHMIALPEDAAGRWLYFRVYSDYTDIGLWGEIKLMERAELSGYIFRHSALALIVGPLCLLLALFAGSFAVIQTERRSFAAIALFGLASGTMILAESQASQLLLDAPLLWDYLAAGSYFTLPIALGLLLEHWFINTRPQLIRCIWQGHLGYLIAALGAAGLGWIDLAAAFPVFDASLLISLVVLLAVITPQLRRLDSRQQAILATFAVFGVLLLADMAVAHGLLPWGRVPVSAGALAFTLAVAMISLLDYADTQRELKRLNQRLETEVAARTHQLQSLVERLEIYSYTDPLTGLHNRRYFDELLHHEARQAQRLGTPLALAMIDIDHFKRVNDRHGHEAGDQVLTSIAATLSEHFRDADVVCRLGGEEFVVLMPGADAGAAQEKLETLMASLAGRVYLHGERMLGPVTISCGIASYPTHATNPMVLARLADQALYVAKEGGRDRVTVYA